MSDFRHGAVMRSTQRGLSLIELMVSMLLGLLIIAGVITIFLSNKQSYGTNQSLAELQDNSRVAFELLARDIRQVGLTSCGNTSRVANVLNNGPNKSATPIWWANFGTVLMGYDGSANDPAVTTGTAAGARITGTGSLALLGISDTGSSVASHNPSTARFTLNDSSSTLANGDIIVACDPDHATLIQVGNYNNATVTLTYATGTTTPGNCSTGLGYPTDCSTTSGNAYQFGVNAQIIKLAAVDWYIGNNPQGGSSLYRMWLNNNAGTASATAQEMVRDVTDMQLTYHLRGGTSFGAASSLAASDWANVDAVRISLQFISRDRHANVNAQPLQRTFYTTIALRNRA